MSPPKTYQPLIGDFVYTVSGYYGTVRHIDKQTLTIEKLDGTHYYASSDAVIRVKRNGQEWMIDRKRKGNYMIPHGVKWASEIQGFYMRNRIPVAKVDGK